MPPEPRGVRQPPFTIRYAARLNVAFVALLWVVVMLELRTYVGAQAVGFVLVMTLLIVPLLWRRRAPVAVFALLSTVAFGQWLFLRPSFGDIALLVALYTLAALRRRAIALAGVAALEFGVFLVVIPHASIGTTEQLKAVVFLSGLVVAAFLLGLNVRIRAAYVAEVEARARRLEFERDQQSQLAAAAERTRIARELHDIVAHNLSVMIALADGAALGLDRDPDQARTAAQEAAATGRRAMADLRQVLGVLRGHGDDPSRAPTPTLADLDTLIAGARDAGLRILVAHRGDTRELSAALQLSAFRIVQEALTNTLKHAKGPTTVLIDIDADPDVLRISVLDDGAAGGLPPAADEYRGHGLAGMRERAALHGGTVSAHPSERGWLVRAALPRGGAAAESTRGTVDGKQA